MPNNPIIKFLQRDNDNARTPSGGPYKKPSFVLSGNELLEKSKILSGEIESLNDKWDVYNEYKFSRPVEVKIIDKAKAKSHQEKIVNLFSLTSSFNQLGMENDDTLILKIKSQEDLYSIKQRLERTDLFDTEISAIDSINSYTPYFDIDEKISKYKIFFLNFNNDNENMRSKEYVLNQLNKNNIAFEEISYGFENIVIIDNVTTDALSFIKNLPIKSLTPIVETENLFRVNKEERENLFQRMEKIKYDSSIVYPVIGLLDSGVEMNDYTRPWVRRGEGIQYTDSNLEKSHGTFIASLLIYGDAMNDVNDYDIEGCKIVDCPIVPSYPISEIELINNIRYAIESNADVKIWNLSVSINREVDTNEFSEFAKELDAIQKEFNVIIIKSAGNDPDNIGMHTLPKKIIHGADSILAITVGSINRLEEPEYKLIQKNPSDYSRTGKGPAFSIKPELVHYGGDYALINNQSTALTELGFSSNSSFVTKAGTSFSAPKIAKNISHLNSLLIEEEFNPLFLKALTIHSADYGEKINISEDERISRLGYGMPQSPFNILNTEDYQTTLALNGILKKSERIDIMDFPFPDSLIDAEGYYYGKLKVTLVYEPYLARDLGNEYCQSEIDIKLGTYFEKQDVEGHRAVFNPIKRTDSENILINTLYSKKSLKGKYLYEKTLIEYAGKYQSIKHYSIDLSTLTDSNKKKYMLGSRSWYLYLDNQYRNFVIKELEEKSLLPETKYSLIISIEDPDKEKNVYHDTISKLNQLNYIHSPIRTDIHIDVE